MDLDIRLLGALEIVAADGVLAIDGQRSSRLLAILLLNANCVVPTDRLVDILWEAPPQSARQQIHNVVGTLRRHVAPVRGLDIVTTPGGYRADVDSDRLDLTRFRFAVRQAHELASAGEAGSAITLLTDARELWHGSALAGLEGHYFVNAGTRLEEERLAATELLMELRVQVGDGALVVGELMELVAAHPQRESLRASLMKALYNNGRQSDALEVYDQGRRLLADEFGLDPSADLRNLHEHILQGLPVADYGANDRPAAPPAPPTEADPDEGATVEAVSRRRFLPHDPREFSGRGREMLQLIDDSRQTGAVSLVISAINGMGGVGKTALAVRFAHTVAADYPDGQYFVDLRGFTIGVEPLTPTSALGILLRQSGLADELIPSDMDGQISAWREQIAGKRALVLLDNAVDAEQVRPLLPGASGPLVLITSRRRLTALEGALPLPLDLMPAQDAVALFARIVGAERLASDADSIADVVDLCGRLPLAIRIAAARFRDRGSWTVSHLIHLLSDQKQRTQFLDLGDRSVSTVLALSYRYLSGDHSRLFRLLSMHPGPDFSAPIAAALAGIPVDRAQYVLESLFDDNLVLQDRPGRYHFHDLIRDCAARLCAEHDNAATKHDAHNRLVDYHLQCAAAWCKPLVKSPDHFHPVIEHVFPGIPEPQSEEQAIEYLALENTNLIEVARSALTANSPHRAWQLVCALGPFLRRTNYTGIALDLFEGALEAARAVGDEQGESLCLTNAALIHRERLQNSKAHDLLEAAIAISRRRGDRSAEMYQIANLAGVKYNSGLLMEAYECYKTALPIVEEMGDRKLAAAIKNNLGAICKDIGRFAEGLDYLAQALSAYRASGQNQSEAYALVNIGMLLVQETRFTEAADYLAHAVEAGRKGSHIDLEAIARAGLCVIHRAQGDLSRSFEDGRAALGLARENLLLEVECEALSGLGEAYLAARDLANADTTFRHTAKLASERHLSSYQARAHEGFAHIALCRGDLPAARRSFQDALLAYPPDFAEAENSQAHLADIESPDVRCLRCVRHSEAVLPKS